MSELSHVARADLREGGRWSVTQRAKNDALWVLASLALRIAQAMPAPLLRSAGRGLGRLAHTLVPGARRIALRNVARAFPELDAASRGALVRRSFVYLGELLADTVSMLDGEGGSRALPLTADAASVMRDAQQEGRGVVFASAHLGPWERVAASLASAGIPLVALGREAYDPRFSRLYERLRSRHGVGVLWRSSPGAAARILRTLRAGRVLGVPMDLRSRVPTCDAPFLGYPAPTPVGPARIALRARAAVVVGTAAPGPGGLVITATRVEARDLRPDAAGARELTARINAELSSRIRALPHGWVWMHDRWGITETTQEV